ncbi:hypothetical protein ABTZ58_38300 [Streptomyces sp. NPDC094143]|uniref:hypothetical protein n=1 Tax=Streptomyces sp. NPDC094143 TaxID=3155310 RepID=UPI00331ED2C8
MWPNRRLACSPLLDAGAEPLRVPRPDVIADDALASIEAPQSQRRRQAAATEAAALPRARHERAARESWTPADVL